MRHFLMAPPAPPCHQKSSFGLPTPPPLSDDIISERPLRASATVADKQIYGQQGTCLTDN